MKPLFLILVFFVIAGNQVVYAEDSRQVQDLETEKENRMKNKQNDLVDELILNAEQGDARAQFDLGALYKNGEGVEQNFQEALKWYQKSAEQGYADAQLILGAMHYVGQGVEQDKVMAFEWWSKAARQGNEAAQKSLDMLCAESPWACR